MRKSLAKFAAATVFIGAGAFGAFAEPPSLVLLHGRIITEESSNAADVSRES